MDESRRQTDPQSADRGLSRDARGPGGPPMPPLPPALEVDHGRLLVHPESIGRQVNLRLWFRVYVVYMAALTLLALTAAALRSGEPGDPAYSAWLLSCLVFYLSLACTFLPIPTTPVVALAAIPYLGLADLTWVRALLIAGFGSVGTMMANLNEYHLWTFLLRYHKAASIRSTRLYTAAIRWFARTPWFTLVAFTFIPIPVDVVRLLAIAFQFPRWRFATACFAGRFTRYALLCWAVGELSEIPGAQWWVVLGITVLTVGGGLAIGLPRLVRLVRGTNDWPVERSENVD